MNCRSNLKSLNIMQKSVNQQKQILNQLKSHYYDVDQKQIILDSLLRVNPKHEVLLITFLILMTNLKTKEKFLKFKL